jgi:hypothetical protein
MPLEAFLRQVHERGQVQISSPAPPDREEGQAALATLREMESRRRLSFPGEPPPFHEEAALWGAVLLYRICQLLVHREAPADEVTGTLSRPCPWKQDAAVSYALDLTLSHLGEVLRLARGRSPEDPLVTSLQELARRFPYSAVGIAGVPPTDPAPWLEHPGLCQVYTDRVLEGGDLHCLEHPRVRECAIRTLGAHPELHPGAAHRLAQEPTP